MGSEVRLLTWILFVLLKQPPRQELWLVSTCDYGHVSIKKRILRVFRGDFGGCHGYDADGFVGNNHLHGLGKKSYSFFFFAVLPKILEEKGESDARKSKRAKKKTNFLAARIIA